MATSIYYFSGTGNSLYAARKLAGPLHAELHAVKDAVIANEITPEADCIGIVFPVYNHRIPFIIQRFTEKLQGIGGKYIFAVCTYGDSPCIALEYLSKLILLRGGALSCGFGVKMPYNYISPSPGIAGLFKPFTLREATEAEQQQVLLAADEKLDAVCEAVRIRKYGMLEAEHQRIEHTVDILNLRETLQKRVWLNIGGFKGKTNLPCIACVQLMDYSFHTNRQCTGCGACAILCPVGNIQINKGPKWLHHCEQCFACLHWCPNGAVEFGGGTAGGKRYRHPGVTFSDMLQKE